MLNEVDEINLMKIIIVFNLLEFSSMVIVPYGLSSIFLNWISMSPVWDIVLIGKYQ